MISKDEFISWKTQQVTLAMFEAIQEYINATKEDLAKSAGNDPLTDRFKVGYITALEDIKNISLEDGGMNV